MKEVIKNIFLNSRGFKSSNQVIVIESDDWGALRMPSKEAYNTLLNQGIPLSKCGYATFDSLETVDDLSALYEMFTSVKTNSGSHPILTANTIVANPDYKRIKAENFQNYCYESIDKTYEAIQGGLQTLHLIKEGMENKCYFPQLHGREHVYINNWMRHLQSGDAVTCKAFNQNVFGVSGSLSEKKRKSFLSALDFVDSVEIKEHEQVLIEAQHIFKSLFGFNSTTFIAPNYTWHPEHEVFLNKIGVKYLQGGRAQKVPEKEGYKTVKHYMGEKNKLGQYYMIRNSSFEPATRKGVNWHKKVLQEAKYAFLLKAPLVISTHRVNFMGGMNEANRKNNLDLFKNILTDLVHLYPNVTFITSQQLGELISKNK